MAFPYIQCLGDVIIDRYFDCNSYLQMGNQHCEECKQIKNSNKAYGEYEVCQYEGKQLALIEKKLEIKPDLARKIEKQLDKRTRITCKNVVRLHKFEILETEYDLGINLFYQFMPKTLREYIEEMSIRGEDFSEKQLFNIIYGVETGLQTLYGMGIPHGCLNLETILFKNSIFKITDISSTTNLTSYELVLQGNREQFLSEKLLNNLSLSMMKPYEFNIVDDLFSLGLIILMIIAKGKPENFYTWHTTQKFLVGTFKMKYIEHCLKIMSRNFSSKLCNKIKSYVLVGKDEKMTQNDAGSLTSELQDLNEDMSRVLNKIRLGFGTRSDNSKENTMRNSLFQTPYRPNK